MSQLRDLVILGTSGFAREVAWLVRDINSVSPSWNLLGHLAASATEVGSQVGDAMVIGDDSFMARHSGELAVAIGTGHPQVISRLRSTIQGLPHLDFPNLIHPSVMLDRARVQFGRGNVVCAGTILTTDIRIGSFNVFNLACTVGHDCVIGDCCVANPGCNISGNVSIGDRCLLGTGSTILQNLAIGEGATIGGGALVNRPVDPGATVAGVPAKPLK